MVAVIYFRLLFVCNTLEMRFGKWQWFSFLLFVLPLSLHPPSSIFCLHNIPKTCWEKGKGKMLWEAAKYWEWTRKKNNRRKRTKFFYGNITWKCDKYACKKNTSKTFGTGRIHSLLFWIVCPRQTSSTAQIIPRKKLTGTELKRAINKSEQK